MQRILRDIKLNTFEVVDGYFLAQVITHVTIVVNLK